MKIQIENVTATELKENLEVIQICVNAASNTKTLYEAFIKIKNEINTVVLWKSGMGANHIRVLNSKNQRLLLITE